MGDKILTKDGDRELLGMALDALLALSKDHGCSAPAWDDSYGSEAIAALRARLALPDAEPVAILSAGDVAEIEDALRSTGRHNKLAYSLCSRLGNPPPQPAPVERKPLSLGELDELAKVYGMDYASPHHITFTVDGLRALIEAAAPQPAPVERKPLDHVSFDYLAKAFASSYASPHHITFTLDGLLQLIAAYKFCEDAA